VAIDTFSFFNFGHVITTTNKNIPFNEGAGELNAEIDVGDYTLGEFIIAIQTAMNAVSITNTFTISINRADNTMTIASDVGNFDLLTTSGATVGTSAYSLMGFSGADKTGAMTYTGGSKSGSQYFPQTMLQDFIPAENWIEQVDASVNETASGRVETVNFGTKSFIEFSLPFITDIVPQDGHMIKSNATGVQDARDFFGSIINKTKFEFVPDIDTTATFSKVILEKTPQKGDGTGFKIEERISDNLPGYFRSGKIKIREVI